MSTLQPVTVFVRGSWHLPKHFEPIRELFGENGYETECPLLPSCGDLTLSEPLQDDAEAAYNAVAKLVVDQGKDVVVVMHSYGDVVG